MGAPRIPIAGLNSYSSTSDIANPDVDTGSRRPETHRRQALNLCEHSLPRAKLSIIFSLVYAVCSPSEKADSPVDICYSPNYCRLAENVAVAP